MKTKGIAVYLKDDEKKKLEAQAKKIGLGLSAYFRSLGLKEIIQEEKSNSS